MARSHRWRRGGHVDRPSRDRLSSGGSSSRSTASAVLGCPDARRSRRCPRSASAYGVPSPTARRRGASLAMDPAHRRPSPSARDRQAPPCSSVSWPRSRTRAEFLTRGSRSSDRVVPRRSRHTADRAAMADPRRRHGRIVARTDVGIPSVRLGLEAHSRRFHFGPDAEPLDEQRDMRGGHVWLGPAVPRLVRNPSPGRGRRRRQADHRGPATRSVTVAGSHQSPAVTDPARGYAAAVAPPASRSATVPTPGRGSTAPSPLRPTPTPSGPRTTPARPSSSRTTVASASTPASAATA